MVVFHQVGRTMLEHARTPSSVQTVEPPQTSLLIFVTISFFLVVVAGFQKILLVEMIYEDWVQIVQI